MFECNNYKAEAARVFAEKFAQELEAEGAAPPSTKFFREITEKMKTHGTVENLVSLATLYESENERQKIEPVSIPLPRASRNFPDVKTRNRFFFHNWTSDIIPFIRFGMQMDGT